MNTSLKHLSPGQRDKLERVVRIIVRAIQPEKIILYGVFGDASRGDARVNASWGEDWRGDMRRGDVLRRDASRGDEGQGDPRGDGSRDNELRGDAWQGDKEQGNAWWGDGLPLVLGAYDLLIVSRQEDRRSDYELQDVIENRCREEAPITALVHDIGYVNRRLAEGQYFFATVMQEGILLYDAHRTPLAKAATPDWKQVRSLAGRDFERWNRQAVAFFRSAQFNQANSDWRVAVFLLHQAAEHIYQAVLLAFTGYKPTTHNLDKLRRYTNRFSLEMAMVFPRDSPKEDDLFRQLLAGYVDARYKEDFEITGEEIGLLLERVGRLLGIAERVCGNHFICLEKRAAGA